MYDYFRYLHITISATFLMRTQWKTAMNKLLTEGRRAALVSSKIMTKLTDLRMAEKRLPFTREQIEHIVRKYPTPFHIYDEKGMRDNAKRLVKAFSWAPGFREYFAVKACPNPSIMKILREEGFRLRLQLNGGAGAGRAGGDYRREHFFQLE